MERNNNFYRKLFNNNEGYFSFSTFFISETGVPRKVSDSYLMGLNSGRKLANMLPLSNSKNIPIIKSILVRVHELSHFKHAVLSPAGILLFQLIFQKTSAISLSIVKLVSDKPLSNCFPLINHITTKLVDGFVETYSDCPPLSYSCLFQRMINIIYGLTDENICIGDAQRHFRTLRFFLPEITTNCEKDPFNYSSISFVNILEALAVIDEYLFLLVNGYTLSEASFFFNDRYGTTYFPAINFLKKELYSGKNIAEIDWIYLQSILMLAAYIPIEATYAHRFFKQFLWENIHPSWRLYKITKASREIGKPENFNHQSFSEQGRLYLQHIEEISHFLGWPSILDIATHSHKSNMDIYQPFKYWQDPLIKNIYIELHRLVSYFIETHSIANLFFLNEPLYFMSPFYDRKYDDFVKKSLSPPFQICNHQYIFHGILPYLKEGTINDIIAYTIFNQITIDLYFSQTLRNSKSLLLCQIFKNGDKESGKELLLEYLKYNFNINNSILL